MLSTSADYKSAIVAPTREIRGYVQFNGTTTMRGCDGLISLIHHAELVEEDRPMFGCVVNSYCEMEFFNSGAAGVSLANSYFDAYIGVVLEDTGTAPVGSIEPDTATVEYVYLGRFIISDIQRGKVKTKVTAYDWFSRLSKEYEPTVVDSGSGYDIAEILNDISTQCNLGMGALLPGSMGYVPELYEGTCRQTVGWIYNMVSGREGCNVTYYRSPLLGTWTVTRLADKWANRASYTIDDNVIFMDGLEINDDFTITSVSSGTEENPIVQGSGTGVVGANPYITSAEVATIYSDLNGKTFTPMTVNFRGDPSIEVGDVVTVSSNGTSYICYVQRMVTSFGGGMSAVIDCFGDSEYYYSLSTSPTETRINNVSNLVQEIQQAIETADGGVITKILDTDGTWKELVIANSADLSTATSVWRFNINGLAHSTSYSGGTYTTALDTNGRIVASLIQTGILQDAAGKNSWNLDTGALTITDGSLNITTTSETQDQITLNYGSYTLSLSPRAVTVKRTASAPPGGYYFATIDAIMGVVACGNGNETVAEMRAATRSILIRDSNGNIANEMLAEGDSVIEKGTSGSWTYRKWYSGKQEVWHRGTFTRTTSQWSAWGGLYVSTATAAQSFPTGVTWTSAPWEYATLHGDNSGWLTNQGTDTTTTASQRYEITRPTIPSASITFYIDYYFVGTWQ